MLIIKMNNVNLVVLNCSRLLRPVSCVVLNGSDGKGYATKPKEVDPMSFVPKHTYMKTFHEPNYLKYLKPQIPFYDLINCQLKGYDYAVLEEYTTLVQKVAKVLGLNIRKYWATPCLSTKYDTLQPDSEVIESSYKVNVYERNIQIKHLTSKQASLFIETIQQTKPVGVTIALHPHNADNEEIRFIPDLQLADMEKELDEWSQPLNVVSQKKKI